MSTSQNEFKYPHYHKNVAHLKYVDVWLLAGGTMGESKEQWLIAENARLMKENEQLMKDVHRIDAARQSAVSQCSVMAEEIEQLNEDVKSLKAALSEVRDD